MIWKPESCTVRMCLVAYMDEYLRARLGSVASGKAGVEQKNLTYMLVPARRPQHGVGTLGLVAIAIYQAHCRHASTGMVVIFAGQHCEWLGACVSADDL